MTGRKMADPRAKELATIALHAVVLRDDWATAATALQAVSDELGGAGVGDVIMLLCDTIIGSGERMRHAAGGSREVPARPVWVNTDTGRVDTSADAVPAAVRWAGQLVAARMAMDRESYEALLLALPEDSSGRSEHVARLLAACAMAVRAERGAR